MVPIIIVVSTSAIVTPSIVATTIIAAAVVSATIVTAVISVAPIRSVPITPVSVIRCAVKRTGAVVARPKKNRDRNWQAEDKSNTSARRRFSEERKSRDKQQEDNELLHNWVLDELPINLIKRNDKNAASCNSGCSGYCKRRNAAPSAAMTNRRVAASTMIPLIAGTCAGRVEIVSRSDSDSSAFRMAALWIGS
jgi:hypothetical protein